MTIAACYLSTEGVVLGADSTSTVFVQGPNAAKAGLFHHYNYAQKVFEIGSAGTVGITMWGLGSLTKVSYRTLVAKLSDQLKAKPANTVSEIADHWASTFWSAYSSDFAPLIKRTNDLKAKAARTSDENDELNNNLNLYGVGFCIGGYVEKDRSPGAFEITFDLGLGAAPVPKPLPLGGSRFWGCPNLINRLIFGLDEVVFQSILSSGKWSGTQQDLLNIVQENRLNQPADLPIREAIDWVHAIIYTTIKGMKFSHLAPVCGGPVEIAVITTDRPYRWVCHKRFDEAISQNPNQEH